METAGPFNRNVSNRIFAAFLSALLAYPTGWGLLTYWTRDHSSENPDWISRLFVNVGMDIVGVLFALSILGVIWAVFMPSWVERLLAYFTRDFVKSLAILLCIILTMLGVAYFTIYRN